MTHPALTLWLAQFTGPFLFGQVWVVRRGDGFELRHERDRSTTESSLRVIRSGELRALAGFTVDGEFRPLKSAADLVSGWRACLKSGSELELALNQLYPGALPDWLAAELVLPPVTSFRQFAARQTGIYRRAAKITDAALMEVVRATCGPGNCVRQRLWPGATSEQMTKPDRRLIPCLEPCPVLLERARRAANEEPKAPFVRETRARVGEPGAGALADELEAGEMAIHDWNGDSQLTNCAVLRLFPVGMR